MRVNLTGRSVGVSLVIVLSLSSLSSSGAELAEGLQHDLAEIDHLYEELDYEHALEQVQRARLLPHAPQEEVLLFLFEGMILCDMGQQSKGKAAFQSALSLSPEAKLPVQASPDVEGLFESVRQSVAHDSPLTRQQSEAPVRQGPQHPAVMIESPTKPTEPDVLKQRPTEELPSPGSKHGVPAARFQSPRTVTSPKPSTATLSPTDSNSEYKTNTLRRAAPIPALLGGTLVVVGGVLWSLSKTSSDSIRSYEYSQSMETAGLVVGAAGLLGMATSAGMYIASNESTNRPSRLHRYASIPAVLGGVSLLAGGTYWALAVSERSDKLIPTAAVLSAVGLTGLAVAVGMSVTGGRDDSAVSLSMGTNGTSAFVYGRWP